MDRAKGARMRSEYRQQIIRAAGIIVACFIAAGCGKSGAGGPPQAGPPEVGVVVMRPERVAITTELPGRTVSQLVAEVRPQVSGIVTKRHFEEGTDVKAGELLYQIDPAMYEAAYANASAGLARAEANVTAIRSRMERYKDLVKIDAVSKQEYDDSASALQQAFADIEANKAAKDTARINLAYTRVTAPITGRIGRSTTTVGALATAGQIVPFATIQQLDPIFVDVTQSSANLLRLRRSIEAGRIKDGGPDRARVKLLLEDSTPYPSRGHPQIFGYHRGPEHRFVHPPHLLSQPQACSFARHVRARPHPGRDSREVRSSRPSRGSPATARAMR